MLDPLVALVVLCYNLAATFNRCNKNNDYIINGYKLQP